MQLRRSILAQVDIKELIDSDDLTPEEKSKSTASLLAERDSTLAEWERLVPPDRRFLDLSIFTYERPKLQLRALILCHVFGR